MSFYLEPQLKIFPNASIEKRKKAVYKNDVKYDLQSTFFKISQWKHVNTSIPFLMMICLLMLNASFVFTSWWGNWCVTLKVKRSHTHVLNILQPKMENVTAYAPTHTNNNSFWVPYKVIVYIYCSCKWPIYVSNPTPKQQKTTTRTLDIILER